MGSHDSNSYKYGAFGSFAERYAAGRREFPEETIDLIMDAIGRRHPQILDLGCGTGIATRQVSSRGAIALGCDISREMINIAVCQDAINSAYVVGSAEDIPFNDAIFDGVTCFSSFHWFDYLAAGKEIRRVLKPNALLAVINKRDTSALKSAFRDLVSSFVKAPLPNVKATYNPMETLPTSGFENIRRHTAYASERLSVEDAVAYFQSVSLWNLVPHYMRRNAEDKLKEFCSVLAVDGYVGRDVAVDLVLADRAK